MAILFPFGPDLASPAAFEPLANISNVTPREVTLVEKLDALRSAFLSGEGKEALSRHMAALSDDELYSQIWATDRGVPAIAGLFSTPKQHETLFEQLDTAQQGRMRESLNRYCSSARWDERPGFCFEPGR